MALELKHYQHRTLAALEVFLAAARGAQDVRALETAFVSARKAALGDNAPATPYRMLSTALPAVPQVCIRIPTGGGKTLLAAHAIERAARLYVGNVHAPVALWLVPTNTIRAQTLSALKQPGHPYRDALERYFPVDRLMVLDIADCDQLRPQDFGGRAIVIVGTIQTLRVDNTTGRDVYAYKEAFEPHFANVPDADFFERIEEKDVQAQPYLGAGDIGKVKRSFANLLAWHRPIVIVDEAHNAQTGLSIEVFNRIRPACLIEWTATPAGDQNVLYHVSAQELKAEDMVKLPIVLSPHPNWQEAVRDAVLTRQQLAEQAVSEPDYVRPIVLFQADSKNGDVPVEALKHYLRDALHISDSKIAVATGLQRELDGINLFDRACPIEFVITVEALKEGWDCSFAYVFCTVQNIRSAKDMEQLLGRVLRLPYARPRTNPALSRAYAHVASRDTALVASQLADRLVAMGFQNMEAAQFIQQPLAGDLFTDPQHAQLPTVESVIALPDLALKALQAAVPQQAVRIVSDGGHENCVLKGVLPSAAIDAAIAAVPKREQQKVADALDRHQVRALVAASPAQRGERFAPILMPGVSVDEQLLLFDPDLLIELADFSLAGQPADLPDFAGTAEQRAYLIDIERGKLKVQQDSGSYQLDLNADFLGITRADVIRELDRRVHRDDVLQPDMIAWLGRVMDGLEARGFNVTYMARHAHQLADAIANRMEALVQESRRAAFQQCLLGTKHKIRLSDHLTFEFDPNHYPAKELYAGHWRFKKHYYALPGDLHPDAAQEETACAIEIDGLSEVKHWVRNLSQQPKHSFWLPTSTDRFYPDFVAQLEDGRLFVVEYKSQKDYSNDDSKEKRTIGEVWAAASPERCVFAMVTHPELAGKSVAAQLRAAITQKA